MDKTLRDLLDIIEEARLHQGFLPRKFSYSSENFNPEQDIQVDGDNIIINMRKIEFYEGGKHTGQGVDIGILREVLRDIISERYKMIRVGDQAHGEDAMVGTTSENYKQDIRIVGKIADFAQLRERANNAREKLYLGAEITLRKIAEVIGVENGSIPLTKFIHTDRGTEIQLVTNTQGDATKGRVAAKRLEKILFDVNGLVDTVVRPVPEDSVYKLGVVVYGINLLE